MNWSDSNTDEGHSSYHPNNCELFESILFLNDVNHTTDYEGPVKNKIQFADCTTLGTANSLVVHALVGVLVKLNLQNPLLHVRISLESWESHTCSKLGKMNKPVIHFGLLANSKCLILALFLLSDSLLLERDYEMYQNAFIVLLLVTQMYSRRKRTDRSWTPILGYPKTNMKLYDASTAKGNSKHFKFL